MDALIIGCKEEFNDFASAYLKCDFFASNYSTFESLKDKGVKYLYDSKIDINQTPSDLEFLSMDWYRDNQGLDIFSKDLISFAPAITRRVFSSFSNDYGNYHAIQKLLHDYEVVYLSSSSELSFKRISSCFEDRVKFYGSVQKYEYPDTSSPERTIIKKPSKKFIILNRMAYLIQSLFIKFVRKKILVLNDWTYRDEFSKRNDCLISSYYLPWKGFYFPYGGGILSESKEIFPKEILNDKFNNEFIQDKLNKVDFFWDQGLIELFLSTVYKVYSDSYNELREVHSSYSVLIKHYRPNTMVFPGETEFSYVIAVQIAKKMKIKTVLAIDGYQVVRDKTLEVYDFENKNLFFDKYVAFGKSNVELNTEYIKIPFNQIIEAQSPLINKLSTINDESYKYDFIVMAYSPTQHNPNSRWDQRIKITAEVVKNIFDLGYKSVAVKIKDGAGSDLELKRFNDFFDKLDVLKLPDIVSGEFNQYLPQTKIVIGQISTALFEAACSKVPYIVYEPPENGVSDYMLEESMLINPGSVARSPIELVELIRKKDTSVLVEHENLISGLPLRDIYL